MKFNFKIQQYQTDAVENINKLFSKLSLGNFFGVRIYLLLPFNNICLKTMQNEPIAPTNLGNF